MLQEQLMLNSKNVPTKNGGFYQHHPVFDLFWDENVTTRDCEPGYSYNFIGARKDPKFTSYEYPSDYHSYEVSIPPIDEEYFEWIDILMSVLDAKENKYTFVELGAGYGRWTVIAMLAAKMKKIQQTNAILVEAEPQHVLWLHEHMSNNGISDKNYQIVEAAISDKSGKISFAVGEPKNFNQDTPASWYGQAISQNLGKERSNCSKSFWQKLLSKFSSSQNQHSGKIDAGLEHYFGKPVIHHESGYKSIKVDMVDIRQVMPQWGIIDLVDMDVQGEEAKIVEAGIDIFNQQVKRLHIGTHSHVPGVEDDLRRVLKANGWICLRDFNCGETNETPYGKVTFGDGVQSWVNPRFNVTLA